MKITIFETEHFESAYPVIKFFDLPGNEIQLVTTPEIVPMLQTMLGKDASRFHWTTLSMENGRLNFFINFYRSIRNFKTDLLFLCTVSSNHLLHSMVLRMLPKMRIILTIHAINGLFSPLRGGNVRKMIRYVGKKRLIGQIKEYNVISDTLIPHLRQVCDKCIIHQIPGAVFQGTESNNAINDHIHLVIAGSIDKNRRNYSQCFELLRFAEQQSFPLHITLLGGGTSDYARMVIQRAKQYAGSVTKIFFFEEPQVPQTIFDSVMSRAHFLFIPSVVSTIDDDTPEIYGKTKSSGNIFDAVRHAKPMITPLELNIPSNLETGCFRYVYIEDIIGLFQTILQQPAIYRRLQTEAYKNSEEYTIEKIRAINISLLEETEEKQIAFQP
jgi:hypothetical protein